MLRSSGNLSLHINCNWFGYARYRLKLQVEVNATWDQMRVEKPQ